MMKRAIALFLLMALALGCLPALAESTPPDIAVEAILLNPAADEGEMADEDDADETDGAESGGILFLPLGTWVLTDGMSWHFITETTATLTPDQQEVAAAAGIAVVDGTMPAGTALSSEQLFSIYPGAEDYFHPPMVQPELELFNLTGEWFYGEDDKLYYRHADGHARMTVDEVFAALNGGTSTAASDKIIYLTIDDSPSKYTMDLLSVLDKLDVKATFFILGAYVKQYPVFMRAIYDQGHTIANHSYSHDAVNLSTSFSSCLRDFQRSEEIIRETLGVDIDIPILRIPYGSTTIPASYRTQLQEHGYMWIDWNALNGDTESQITSDQKALDRAISTAGRYDGSIVMLVHDGKKRTIRTMEEMVTYFRDQGYTFGVLDTSMEKIPGVRTGYPK